MTVGSAAGMSRGPRARALAAAALACGLGLAGCSGDDDAASEGTAGPTGAATTGGTGGGTQDAAGGTEPGETAAGGPVAPPTAPADITAQPGERSAGGGTSVVVEGDRAAFVSPEGDIACTVNAVTAVCQVQERAFTPQPDHVVVDTLGSCTADQADAIMLATQGAWTCVEDDLLQQAWVATGGWWAAANESETVEVDDFTLAVLPYGSTISVGAITCSSAQDGVTCTNSETGRSFFVSPGSYQYG